jgi:hypothetical protein
MAALAAALSSTAEAGAACSPQQTAKLLVGNATAGDEFGSSVAVDDDVAIVGAQRSRLGGESAGAAYIYRKNPSGHWLAADKLTPADGEGEDYFGWSVALDGDTAVVGAYSDDDGGTQSGAAYVFRDNGAGEWQQVAKLTSNDAAPYDYFGSAVALAENTILVGAYGDDDGGGNYGGAVYVYVEDDFGNWTQVDQLVASDAAAFDYFGYSIAMDGGVALIGAYGNDERGSLAGAVYVFREYGEGTWIETAKITADDAEAYDNFGFAVDIDGDAAVIGAYGDDDLGNLAGSAYIFRDNGIGAWQQTAKLAAADGEESAYFGRDVAIHEDIVLVGAHRDDERGEAAGAAYLFGEDDLSAWYEIAKLTASDGVTEDHFGAAVGLAEGTAFVGAAAHDAAGVNAGAVYLYSLNCGDGPPTGRPYVADIEIDPEAAEPDDVITVTARLGGYCPDALNAAFYADTNFDGALDSFDELVGWVDAADGDCAIVATPTVQAAWADPSGMATLFARVSHLGDDGLVQWSAPEAETLTIVSAAPIVDVLNVAPDPVTPGEMATVTATLDGGCHLVDVVAFYYAPGADADFTDAELFRWREEADGDCQAAAFPTIGADWDGGTGAITFFARARWSDGQATYWSEPKSRSVSTVGVVDEVEVTDLFADPNPVEEGERVRLDAFLEGGCDAVNAVAFYRAAGPGRTLDDAVLVKWQTETDGDCESTIYPLVGPSWDGGTGTITFLARARWVNGDGNVRWTEPAVVEVDVIAGEPAVSELAAQPNPVEVDERVTLTAHLSGACAKVDVVAFYRAPGPGGTLDNATLLKWQPETDGDCTSSAAPIVQPGWHGGTYVVTFLARARWFEGQQERWTDPVAVEVTIIDDTPPVMQSLEATPETVQVGELLELTARLQGACDEVDTVAFYRAPGANGTLDNATLLAWQPELEGDCLSIVRPTVQAGWDGGTGTITFLARARWHNGQNYVWTDPVAEEVPVLGGSVYGGDVGADAQSDGPDRRAGHDAGRCLADLDGDRRTDRDDLALLLAAYEVNADGDIDGDGDTDEADLSLLLSDFGCDAGPIG